MTNQAAQTMPLPPPAGFIARPAFGPDGFSKPPGVTTTDAYTADQMHQYARDYAAMLAAAPAASGGVDEPVFHLRSYGDVTGDELTRLTAPTASHPDALQDGTRSKSTAKRVEALAASGGEDSVAAIREALQKVIDAVGAYLPPDGISREDLISLVIEATDNPEIVRAMK